VGVEESPPEAPLAELRFRMLDSEDNQGEESTRDDDVTGPSQADHSVALVVSGFSRTQAA